MSLILFMETDEGLILSGDSRLSSKIDPNWHEDTAEKVFKCNERVGIAYHGDADIKGEPIEKIIKDFICTVDKDDIIKQITEKLKEYIKTKGNINQVYMNIDRKILTKNENTITKPPRKIKIILCFIVFF